MMVNNNMDNLKNTKVLVVGLGKSGVATAQVLPKLGAKVYVQDIKRRDDFPPSVLRFLEEQGVDGFYLGETPKADEGFDMIILSPGVDPQLDFITKLQKGGAQVVGELELAYRMCKGQFIAITGTNGKTTTTTLVGEIFSNGGLKTKVVGNIGVAAIGEAVSADENTFMIAEASSFQLETTKYFKPKVSAILNVAEDHLDRHGTMENYGKAKAMIFANQRAEDYLVVNYDHPEVMALVEGAKCKIAPFSKSTKLEFGGWIKDGWIVVSDGTKDHEILPVEDIKLIGLHNLENVLAAATIAFFAGVKETAIGRTIAGFTGVPHRIEFVGKVDGVLYYNDSKGTNEDAAITALKSMDKEPILIAGGDGKGQTFEKLGQAVNDMVDQLILLGKDAPAIENVVRAKGFDRIHKVRNMAEAVNLASRLADKGQSVLLSPACASWDMYDNYQQRGDDFKEQVRRLEA